MTIKQSETIDMPSLALPEQFVNGLTSTKQGDLLVTMCPICPGDEGLPISVPASHPNAKLELAIARVVHTYIVHPKEFPAWRLNAGLPRTMAAMVRDALNEAENLPKRTRKTKAPKAEPVAEAPVVETPAPAPVEAVPVALPEPTDYKAAIAEIKHLLGLVNDVLDSGDQRKARAAAIKAAYDEWVENERLLDAACMSLYQAHLDVLARINAEIATHDEMLAMGERFYSLIEQEEALEKIAEYKAVDKAIRENAMYGRGARIYEDEQKAKKQRKLDEDQKIADSYAPIAQAIQKKIDTAEKLWNGKLNALLTGTGRVMSNDGEPISFWEDCLRAVNNKVGPYVRKVLEAKQEVDQKVVDELRIEAIKERFARYGLMPAVIVNAGAKVWKRTDEGTLVEVDFSQNETVNFEYMTNVEAVAERVGQIRYWKGRIRTQSNPTPSFNDVLVHPIAQKALKLHLEEQAVIIPPAQGQKGAPTSQLAIELEKAQNALWLQAAAAKPQGVEDMPAPSRRKGFSTADAFGGADVDENRSKSQQSRKDRDKAKKDRKKSKRQSGYQSRDEREDALIDQGVRSGEPASKYAEE